MAKDTVTFTVKSSPETVFALSNDLRALGALVPDVKKVEIVDERNAFWYLTTKIGFVTRTIKLHTIITKLESPKHADFSGDSDELALTGSVDLTPLPVEGTEVACKFEAFGKGPLKNIINGLLETRIPEEVGGFVKNLQEMLEK